MEKLYTISKTRPGDYCGSDHQLLTAKFRLTLKKVGKTTRPARHNLSQPPYKYAMEVMNSFKGLDLVNRVPEELWTEVHNIIQEAVNKTNPKKKKSKKAKWLSEEALRITKERREAKSKREREGYIQLNVEFQRIARRDKKAFFNEQCVKLEQNRGERLEISSGKLEISRELFTQRWPQ